MNKLPQTPLTLANAAFRSKDYARAIALYEEAISQQGLAVRCSVKGVRNLPDKPGAFIEGTAELSVDCARTVRNFYLCG